MGVEKGMGLKKGEKVRHLGLIRIDEVLPTMLDDITQDDVVLEGFPDMTPHEFIKMFCKHNKCGPLDMVNRIEFEYVT